MNSSTVSELSLLETLEQKLQADVSVSVLAEIERELLRLRSELSIAEWDALCEELPKRQIFQILRLGTLTAKRLQGPNFDFPADVLDIVMADSFRARESVMTSPAHTISGWEFSLPTSRSMRARKAYFAREIAETIRTTIKPRILSLGSGRGREEKGALQSGHLHHAQFVALQPDVPAREWSSESLQIEKGGWADLSHLRTSLGLFDLIYSVGWLDFTADSDAAEWLAAGVEMLRGGGRLLAANLAPGSRDAGWTEACWNWHPHYRSEEDLAQLVMNLKSPAIRGHALFRDESGASAYLEIHSI